MPDKLAIDVQGLRKSYGRVQALRGLDLQVRAGEIFGFLGPNGAGKTTTIRCLLDLIRPNGGSARVLGLDPQADSVEVRRRVGYLPGDLRLDENLTVDGVLRYLGRLRGGRTDWGFVHRLCARLDLDSKLVIKNLSKGNKQKIGVVQAMMHRPALLMMDEPTFGLDPLMQREVLRLLREAKADGATVFFSSHILSEVQEVAERVAIIRQGVVVELADPAMLIHRALRRVRVSFTRPVDIGGLQGIPRVRVLRQEPTAVLLEVEGPVDALIKALAAYPLQDLETERPSLEEIFLAYYSSSGVEAAR